ncbi:MBL fold metallo-hydrolase [Palaeococcus ferrophilus]|uniref:MBL fold metallo-hydrolase n=1 Tax=Palaeococcus ferrophilus TaxID=83868 RepID=UPI00064F2BC6|nr:MBL fold metallo-hydrolase [Palaeococcus ferrophilus]
MKEIGEDLYLYPGSPSTMVKLFEGRAVLVDPGNGKKRHKELRRELRKLGLEASHLLATHGHADHVAVVPKLEKPLLIHRFEFSIAESPLNRELLTFGSKAPEGFLVYQFPGEVKVHGIFEWGDELFGLRALKLDGHSPGMTGFMDEDNAVIYAGDSFFGERLLKGIGVPYLVEPALFMESLERLRGYAEEGFLLIPSHGPMVKGEDAIGLIETNRKAVENVRALILRLLERPMSVDELSYSMALEFGAPLTPKALALNQVPIKAILATLYNERRIEAVVEGGIKWRLRRD